MNSEDYIPGTEAGRVIWFGNLASAAATLQTPLGLTAADIAALNSVSQAYKSAVANATLATNALRAANKDKAGASEAITAAARDIVRRIQSNPAATPAMKAQLRINTRTAPRTKTAPVPPTQLLATPDASGINRLQWNRNGNKKTTNYLVEALFPGASAFTFVGDTAAKSFEHTGQTPGVTVVYRVTASRAKMRSAPSQTAAVYLHTPQVALSKAA